MASLRTEDTAAVGEKPRQKRKLPAAGGIESEPASGILFVSDRSREYLDPTSLSQLIGTGPSGWPLALLKELIDNSLDACEAAGIAPVIKILVGEMFVSVEDNGPGLPEAVIRHALDFQVRASSKSHFITPTRGRLGNALKCVAVATGVMPVEDGDGRGHTDIESDGRRWRISVRPDDPVTAAEWVGTVPSVVKTGTKISLHFLSRPWSVSVEDELIFTNVWAVAEAFAACNPHAHIEVRGGAGESVVYKPTDRRFAKWSTRERSSPHWYEPADLRKLVAGCVEAAARGEKAPRTVRELVECFAGLSGTSKKAAVADRAKLSGALLPDLVCPRPAGTDPIRDLLTAMKAAAKPVRAAALGRIGESHLSRFAGSNTRFRYKRITSEKGAAIPFVVEAAFALAVAGNERRRVVLGLNWTPLSTTAFREFDHALDDNLIDEDDHVQLVVHVACPQAGSWADHGKTRMNLSPHVGAAVGRVIRLVTTDWRKFKRQKRRDQQVRGRALDDARRQLARGHKGRIRELIHEFIPAAYAEASDGGRLPANVRQIMYSCRARVLSAIETERVDGDFVKDKSFTTSILPRYIADHPAETRTWDVIYDARGNLTEPHTGRVVPIGTKRVREYVIKWTAGVPAVSDPFPLPMVLPTVGPANRYSTVLFVEKEGFDPIIQASGILKRFDVALMSTKGMSVTAARSLVEELSARGVQVLVAHDFDKTGFSIIHTLRSNTARYKFQATPNVHDIGLRLEDVRRMGLASESVEYQKQNRDPAERLRECGATAAECTFLVHKQVGKNNWAGQRVELNAMGSAKFIEFLERAFAKHGVKRLVPTEADLSESFGHLARWAEAKRRADDALRSPDLVVPAAPKNLTTRVAELLSVNPEWSWDRAVTELVQKASDSER